MNFAFQKCWVSNMHEWKLVYVAKDAKMNPYKWGCVKCKSTLWTDVVQRPLSDVKSGGLTYVGCCHVTK